MRWSTQILPAAHWRRIGLAAPTWASIDRSILLAAMPLPLARVSRFQQARPKLLLLAAAAGSRQPVLELSEPAAASPTPARTNAKPSTMRWLTLAIAHAPVLEGDG